MNAIIWQAYPISSNAFTHFLSLLRLYLITHTHMGKYLTTHTYTHTHFHPFKWPFTSGCKIILKLLMKLVPAWTWMWPAAMGSIVQWTAWKTSYTGRERGRYNDRRYRMRLQLQIQIQICINLKNATQQQQKQNTNSICAR